MFIWKTAVKMQWKKHELTNLAETADIDMKKIPQMLVQCVTKWCGLSNAKTINIPVFSAVKSNKL